MFNNLLKIVINATYLKALWHNGQVLLCPQKLPLLLLQEEQIK